MRVATLTLTLLWSLSAVAHIKLTEPTSWITTDGLGNPQKSGPCGAASGTSTNAVTTLEAGSKVTVKWTETIFHPGHFRIAIAADRSQLITPVPVVQNNDCKSAPIDTNPTWPVIADGIDQHLTGQDGDPHEYEITVPDVECDNCTLQLMQFMSSHTPGCFYFQCANVKIVKPDGGSQGEPDGGDVIVDAGEDAGSVPLPEDAGVDTDAGTQIVDAGTKADGGSETPGPVGCGCQAGAGQLGILAGLCALWVLTRRRSPRSA
jgi:hypothetical protein